MTELVLEETYARNFTALVNFLQDKPAPRKRCTRQRKRKLGLMKKYNSTCQYCGEEVQDKPEGNTAATLDHILTVYYGGPDNLFNLTLACFSCNIKRGNKPDKRQVLDHFGVTEEQIRSLV